jgi:hypothetical protein
MITATVIEYFPQTYDGGVPICGTGAGGRRLFNGMYDLRVLFEYACRDVPDARFVCGLCSDGETRCVADDDCASGETCDGTETPPLPEDGLTYECTEFVLGHPERFASLTEPDPLVGRAITACFGDTVPTPEQAARRDFVVRASQLPDDQLDSSLYFASVGLAEIVHRRTGGKHPWSNVGVEYASPLLTAGERAALNADVHRSASAADAVRYLRRFYEPRGRTHAKVITVHALDDGLVIPEHEEKYRQAFEASGRTEQLVQFFTPIGKHCANAVAFRPALEQMIGWVERGELPTDASMNAACGGCLTSTVPGAFGQKVPERAQKGAPLRRMVCAGQPGDCPAGSSCSMTTRHCE